MRQLHVGAAALNQTLLDWDGNVANIRRTIEAARTRGVSILCLSELAITGYGCDVAFFSCAVQERAAASLQELKSASAGIVVSVGLPLVHADKNLYSKTWCRFPILSGGFRWELADLRPPE